MNKYIPNFGLQYQIFGWKYTDPVRFYLKNHSHSLFPPYHFQFHTKRDLKAAKRVSPKQTILLTNNLEEEYNYEKNPNKPTTKHWRFHI